MRKLALILFISLFLLGSCNPIIKPIIPVYYSYEINNKSFGLKWDSKCEVDSFNLYFREHGETDWKYLGETYYTTYIIDNDILLKGKYDFAVTSVLSGIELSKHTSLDEDAKFGGWFLNLR